MPRNKLTDRQHKKIIARYAETQNYVKKVLSKYDTYKGANG